MIFRSSYKCKSGPCGHWPRRDTAVGIHANRNIRNGNFIFKQLLSLNFFYIIFANLLQCKL